ncbi:hypothetical protein DFH06DRAFT_1391716 [Mycena polygramma]|nr:hypothetical protein DFH06DRAFT_1391716 [Mycena polygramma]
MGSLGVQSFEARLVPSTLWACATILVYDLLCTLDQEILYVWPRPWSMSTALFIFNRYLPFVDTFLSISGQTAFPHSSLPGLKHPTAKFSRISPEACLVRNKAVGWLSLFGVMLSESILILRTYAIWERKRSVLIFLCGLAFCTFLPIIVFVYLETQSLIYTPDPSDGLGCFLSHAGSILIYGYLMIMISETAIAVLTAIKAYRDLRRSRVRWIEKLYKDGMLFYVYLLLISLANVMVPILAPTMFANWLATPQRVLHSVLCTRVLLLILRQRRRVTTEVSRSTWSESEGTTGMVFSSVVDDEETSDATSAFRLTTLESSSSQREAYTYPVSPGADQEEDGRARFNW